MYNEYVQSNIFCIETWKDHRDKNFSFSKCKADALLKSTRWNNTIFANNTLVANYIKPITAKNAQ